MEKPFFKTLDNCLLNTSQAYFIGFIIGDCFCPGCKTPVLMHEPLTGDFLWGHCKCGLYIKADILLDSTGRYGKWNIKHTFEFHIPFDFSLK